MADAIKRTECVKVCFDERLFIDLNREAIKRDRKLADLVFLICRQWRYGNGTPEPTEEESTKGDRDGL
jgi:hypothetical protein